MSDPLGTAGPPPLRPFGLVLHHDGRFTHEGEPILNRRLRGILTVPFNTWSRSRNTSFVSSTFGVRSRSRRLLSSYARSILSAAIWSCPTGRRSPWRSIRSNSLRSTELCCAGSSENWSRPGCGRASRTLPRLTCCTQRSQRGRVSRSKLPVGVETSRYSTRFHEVMRATV